MNKHVHQGHLEFIVRQLFPTEYVQSNVRKEGSIKNPSTGYFLELDIRLSSINLSLEFQDAYHYTTTWDSHFPLSAIQQKDAKKIELMRERQETLVLVPCWWDGYAESLGAEIHAKRPDLLEERKIYPAIPMNPPVDLLLSGVPGVGELMLASFPGPSFDETISLSNSWWMGEKFDGVRFCWNPGTKTLYTRAGLKLFTSPKFRHSVPRQFLDGEVWFGRGCYVDSQRLLSQYEFSCVDWSSLRFITFDTPSAQAAETPFEQRYAALVSAIDREHPFIILAYRVLCISANELLESLQLVIKDGGEGVVLRRPDSFYIPGRSESLFKLKAARGDQEALVETVLEDEGDETMLLLRLPDDSTFTAPLLSPDLKPKRGDVVTFSYKAFSRRATPVDPKAVRVRLDLSWEDVLREHVRSQALNDSTNKVLRYAPKPTGYWNNDRGKKNMREVLESIALSSDLDPLLAESWYSISRTDALQAKHAKTIIAKYGGSFIDAVIDLFPEIVFDETSFSGLRKNHWMDINNRRQLFVDFAQEEGLDPLSPDTWYKASRDKIGSFKGLDSVLTYYNGSLVKGLVSLFPEIGLDVSKFSVMPQNYWSDKTNIRKFFEKFATANVFDPLVAKNWYSVTLDAMKGFKGLSSVLYHYKGNLAKALLEMFPNIGLIPRKLIPLAKNYWDDPKRRRNFFIEFAKEKGFDPLAAENWYSVPPNEIRSRTGAPTLLCYHGTTTKALLQLFPEIGLEKTRFLTDPVNMQWQYPKKRRSFFEKFAHDNKFDPLVPNNWYPISLESILEQKNSFQVLKYHNESFIKAVMDLFPDLLWEEYKFACLPLKYWRNVNHRRAFFTSFAASKKFDPLIPDNWKLVSKEAVSSEPGGRSLLQHYRGNLTKALIKVFPEWESDRHPFNYWKSFENRRNFFVDMGVTLGFDPLVATNWYSVPHSSMVDYKYSTTVMRYYQGNFGDALMDVFPDIGLERSKLPSMVQWNAIS